MANARLYKRRRIEKESIPRADIQPPYYHRLRSYDRDQVQEIWEDSIELDLNIIDPYYAESNDEYQHRIMTAVSTIRRVKRKKSVSNYSIVRDAFRCAPYHEQKVLEHIYRFESRMQRVEHSVCRKCKQCSLNLSTTKRSSICVTCRSAQTKDSYTVENSMLPIWFDDAGIPQYHVPMELKELTIAEVLLIQRVAPLVPIYHVRNGTMGIRGHVCSFLQDINGVASRLPNLPSSVTAVKMVRTYKGADGAIETRCYMVNRRRVMKALYWLVRYHRDYRQAYENGDLVIDFDNLNWMGDEEEAQLPTVANMTHECNTPSEAEGDVNYGVSREQVHSPEQEFGCDNESSGVACPANTSLTSEAQDAVIRALREAASNNPNISVLDWPQMSTEAISEYSDTTRIFVNAFPHLFPGGIADINEQDRKTDVSISNWAKHLLLYDDGRFAKDPIWPFFAYNYSARKRNTQMGAYFVNNHISDPPRSIEQLQQDLRDGNFSFVNKIMFYSKRTRGTDAYWRYKRAEMYNWIHYHIAARHGAPNIFLTLSCAEYFWPDMIRLLEERIWIAEGRNNDNAGRRCYSNGTAINLSEDKKARNKAVNDYAIVVQEFFILRLEDWLNTVGRNVLHIKYYIGRLEFAKGRGQIHCHLIAILDQSMMTDLQRQLRQWHMSSNDEAKIVGEWARENFGLSATFNDRERRTDGNTRLVNMSYI